MAIGTILLAIAKAAAAAAKIGGTAAKAIGSVAAKGGAAAVKGGAKAIAGAGKNVAKSVKAIGSSDAAAGGVTKAVGNSGKLAKVATKIKKVAGKVAKVKDALDIKGNLTKGALEGLGMDAKGAKFATKILESLDLGGKGEKENTGMDLGGNVAEAGEMEDAADMIEAMTGEAPVNKGDMAMSYPKSDNPLTKTDLFADTRRDKPKEDPDSLKEMLAEFMKPKEKSKLEKNHPFIKKALDVAAVTGLGALDIVGKQGFTKMLIESRKGNTDKLDKLEKVVSVMDKIQGMGDHESPQSKRQNDFEYAMRQHKEKENFDQTMEGIDKGDFDTLDKAYPEGLIPGRGAEGDRLDQMMRTGFRGDIERKLSGANRAGSLGSGEQIVAEMENAGIKTESAALNFLLDKGLCVEQARQILSENAVYA